MSTHGPCPGGCQPGGQWVDFTGQDLEDIRQDDPAVETFRTRLCPKCGHVAQIQATHSIPQDSRRRR